MTLEVIRNLQDIAPGLQTQDFFDHPTLSQFARRVEAAPRARAPSAADAPAIAPRNDPGPAPLSFAQESLWLVAEGELGGGAYHIPFLRRLKGALNRDALVRALEGLMQRHDILRTRFDVVDGEVVQIVEQSRGSPLQVMPVREAELGQTIAALIAAPFDLKRGPLIRATLLEIGEDDHVLIFVLHHIIYDGASFAVVRRDVQAMYNAFIAGEPNPLAPPPLQYADYAAWQRRATSPERRAAMAAYWVSTLRGAPPLLALPTDRPRPAEQDFAGRILVLRIGEELTQALIALTRRRKVTLFRVALAAWAVMLSRLSGQQSVVVGTPTAGRERPEVRDMIGYFVTTLPLRLDIDPKADLGELLDQIGRRVREGVANQDIGLPGILEAVSPPRQRNYNALFQTIFTCWTLRQEWSLTGLVVEPLERDLPPAAKADLSIDLRLSDTEVRMTVDYAAALFEEATVRRYVDYFVAVLAAFVRDETQPVGEIDMLSQAERRRLLNDWNATDADFPRDLCLHQLIEAQARRTPEAIAVSLDEARLTFGELNAGANRLARHLRGLGVRRDDRVAICAERSLDLVVGLLATLKAGGAYVPLDPAYPADRLAYMLEDAAPRVVLTHGPARPALDAAARRAGERPPVIDLAADAPLWSALEPEDLAPSSMDAGPGDLAYIIYTSGSTGRPKGAMNEHRAVVNRLWWMQREFALNPGESVLQKTPVSFDVSVWELFWPLIVGGRLVLARPEGHKDPAYLLEIIRRERVAAVHFVPSMLRAFLEQTDAPSAPSLRHIVASGEALPADLARRCREMFPTTALTNLYGPTEAAVDVSAWRVALDPEARDVPIGKPIANTRLYILDDRLQPAPRGAIGEIYIGGVQVGRGYWNRPDLTAERFLESPFVAGERLYKTGDLGRYRADGEILFAGRNDFQVKVRGFRVELGEIEAALTQHAGVAEAVVIATQDACGETRLAAYVRPGPDAPALATDDLRQHLSKTLPDYMTPAAFVLMDSFPLTPSGKIDRAALPTPGPSSPSPGLDAPPEGELEETLARLWAETLGLERVGRHQGFFDLGGHSLLGLRLLRAVEKSLGRTLALGTLFQAQTVADFAACLRGGRTGTSKSVVPLHDGGPGPMIFMIHLIERDLARHLGRRHGVCGLSYGLAAAEGSMPPPPPTVEEVASHYIEEMLLVQPKGPYRLVGHSFGGLFAFEMAQQLKRRGEDVALLGLLDTYPAYGARTPLPAHRVLRNLAASPPRVWVEGARSLLAKGGRNPATPGARPWADPEMTELRRPLFDFVKVPYQLQPYDGEIHLFKAARAYVSLRYEAPPPRELIWGRLALGGLKVRTLPGDHMDLVKDPIAAQTALAIEAALSAPA
jgi:amino acid adenylation domain-containing protein